MDKFFNECLKCLDPFKSNPIYSSRWSVVCFSPISLSHSAFHSRLPACGCHHLNSGYIMLAALNSAQRANRSKEEKQKIHRLSALCVRNIHISTHYNCDVTRDSTECFAIFVPPNKFYCFNVDCVIKSA